jgi:hypothetical protein
MSHIDDNESDISDLSELSEVESDNDDSQDEPILNKTKLRVSINTQTICATHFTYLTKNKLLTNPEYQRTLCWNNLKMCNFIDTIMKGLIVPNFVIYKLSQNEVRKNIQNKLGSHLYECIDGQHRLVTIKHFIESIPNNDKYIFWKNKDANNKDERVYYDMNDTELQKIKRQYKRKYIVRNLTEEEKQTFDDFQISIHSIETDIPMSIHLKCDIFNRLQNGEKVSSWIKLRNMNNLIINTIRDNYLLNKLKEIEFINKIYFNNSVPSEPESFYIYYLIRTFLIVDKKHLEVNYLDFNIKRFLEENNNKGSPQVQIIGDINQLVPKVIEVIEIINKDCKHIIISEFAYIFVCIYANFGLEKLKKIIKFFNSNKLIFDKYNNIKLYTDKKVTSSKNIIKIYNEIIGINIDNKTKIINA